MEERLLGQNKYPDRAIINKFYTLSDEALFAVSSKAIPSLSVEGLCFIRNTLRASVKRKKELRTPTLGELRLYGEIFSESSKNADLIALSSVEGDGKQISDTYADLLAKVKVLYKKGAFVPTLDALANVSKEYTDMIGRDCGTLYAYTSGIGNKSSDVLSVTDIGGREAFHFTRKEEDTFAKRADYGISVFILRPIIGINDEYEANAKRFFASAARFSLYRARAKVGRHGIIGALMRLTDGAAVDTSVLYKSEEGALPALALSDRGRYIVIANFKNAKKLSILADRYGLTCTEFARTNDSECFKLMMGKKSLELKSKFLSSIMNYREKKAVSLPCGAAYLPTEYSHPVFRGGIDGRDGLEAFEGRCFYSHRSDISADPFKEGFFSALDASIALVSRGVNRRSVCMAYEYSFPRSLVSGDELGKDLALILGVYRFNMELAAPTAISSVKYGKGRGLLTVSYSMRPKVSIASMLSSEGNKLCFMGFDVGEDGLPDMNSYRQMCDRFFELAEKGKVISAYAVTGSLSAAVYSMSGKLAASFNDKGEAMALTRCRGIVFEVSSATGLEEIGIIVKNNDEELAVSAEKPLYDLSDEDFSIPEDKEI